MTNSINFYTVLATILVYVITKMFYYCFKLAWPKIYFSTSDFTGLFFSVSLKRFLLFRYLPPLIITTLIFGIFNDYQTLIYSIIGALMSGLMYGLSTDGKALFELLTNSNNIKTFFNKHFQIFVHLINIISLLLISALGGYIATLEIIDKFTPTLAGLIDNIYSSLLTALVAVFLYKIYSETGKTDDKVFSDSLNQISKELKDYIETESEKLYANKNLVLAICIAENIQRPSWFRKIERVKGLIFKSGSYGIMQVSCNKPISDRESITLAVKKYFKNSSTAVSFDDLLTQISNYNNDEQYIDIVMRIYSFLEP